MNKRTLLMLVLVFVILMGGAYTLYSKLSSDYAPNQLASQPPQASAAAGENDNASQTAEPEPIQVPDFLVYDIDGNEVRLSDFFGKPIVLNFWASWCGPCQMEMPDFDEAYKRLEGEVEFLMVNVTGGRETKEQATAFIEQKGFSFPVFYDLDMTASTSYGAYSLPTTYFIDAQGYGIAAARGAIDAETLQKGLDMIHTAE